MDLTVYNFAILKNGNAVSEVKAFDKDFDIDEKVKNLIEEKETGNAREFALSSFSDKNSPPWQRIKMSRKPLVNKTEILSSLTDEGNAVRFEEECKGWLIFDTKAKEWYAWQDNRYEKAGDKFGRSMRFVGKSLAEEAEFYSRLSEENPDDTELKKISADAKIFANQSMNYYRQNAIRKMLESSAMQIDLEKSADYDWITFVNGAVNSKTGEFLEIWECERLKNVYPVVYFDRVYTEGQKSPEFTKTLSDVFDDNITENLSEEDRFKRKVELGRFFLRMIGYSLVNGNPEQIILFIYGSGSNGKSTVIDSIRFVLGDEVCEASIKELYASSEDRPASGISGALNRRILLLSEASDSSDDKGGKISRDSVKALTGDEYTSRFRRMYEKSRQQRIVCLPIGVTNELPNFDKELDFALLRRILTIPFPRRFTESDRRKDIREALRAESDAVFSMMVDELRVYVREGLLPVPEFCKMTQSELLAGFEISSFIDSCLEKTDGSVKMSRAEIEEAYIAFCDVNDIDVPLKMVVAPGYSDDYGTVNKRQSLADKEKRRLFKGLRVKGVEECKSGVVRSFNCKVKR